MQGSPLVSIIIPTKNRAALLLQALDSVRAQSYPNWECRVIDDRSTDDTLCLVQSIAESDARVTIKTRPAGTSGANVCRNFGFAGAQGDYVIFLDSDDLLVPHCLAGRVAAMEADPSLDFAVFGIEVFMNTPGDFGMLWNAPSELEDMSRFLEIDSVWQTMAPIWRRDALERLGPWDEALLGFQDWELHIRAIAMGLKYRIFPETDCAWRAPSDRDAIGSHISSFDSLRSHIRLLSKIRQVLDDNSGLNEPRKRRLIGLYLWLADKFRRGGSYAEAAGVWRRCREEQLVSDLTWVEGWIYLLGQEIPFFRRMTRRYLLSRWPNEMIRKGSRTVMNVPMRPDVVRRQPRKLAAGFYEFPA